MSNEFLLPNELGWVCNDKLQEYVKGWYARTEVLTKEGVPLTVSTAELIDNVYAIIKKYQVETNEKQ